MNKIIIVDDHSLFREGVKLLIENEGLGIVIAEAENGQVFLDLLEIHKPDLVIMDIEMPILGGIEATKKALSMLPNLKILALTMQNDRTKYIDLILAGVLGFVHKTSGKSEFEKAIKAIIRGESYFSYDTLQTISDTELKSVEQIKKEIELPQNLTAREKEILYHLYEGLSVIEIANLLFLSVKTIEAHRTALLRKTNSKNTFNLVLYGLQHDLAIY